MSSSCAMKFQKQLW